MNRLLVALFFAAILSPAGCNLAAAQTNCNTYCYWLGDQQVCNTTCY